MKFLLASTLAGATVAKLLPAADSQVLFGCGLLGPLPGIDQDGTTTAEVQKMIDGLKVTSSGGKVSYWNWDLAPIRNNDNTMQHLSKDFVFMPEQWGLQAVNGSNVRQAGVAGFPDGEGQPCAATMAEVFLGANEPDIQGSCMGNMMGKCTAPCTPSEALSGCPMAQLSGGPPDADPLPNGHCNCWQASHATGCGYWPFSGCTEQQPLPAVFNESACLSAVMTEWQKTAAAVAAKGYKYLTAPLIAVSMDWQEQFIHQACGGECKEVACGCPTHMGWHFYAADCRPTELGGYADFQHKLDTTKRLMETYPHLQGAIVNEVGMLNCAQKGGGVCIPNGSDQKYPANQEPNNACPNTEELPNGLGTFVETLFDMVINTGTTSDGRHVVAGFSWFNEDMNGGTYNLRIFDDDGKVNSVGDAYIKACQKWGDFLGTTNTTNTSRIA